MNLQFLLPLGLVALAAWLLPLLIHLVRRPEQTPYDFPALRWIRESERPRRRLRLDDLALLLLRLLLLALMALLLAVPVLRGEWRDARHWVLVGSTIDLDAARTNFPDPDVEWRWLAPGFPPIEEVRPAADQATASLVREFEATLPPADTLSILVPEKPDGFDAERIALGRDVEWSVAGAIDASGNVSQSRKPLMVALRHAGDGSDALGYLRAALAALGSDEPDSLKIDDKPASMPVDFASDAVIWLDGKLPDELLPWIEAGGRALVVDSPVQAGSIVLRDESGGAVASEQVLGEGAVVQLLRPMTPESLPLLLDADFPERLRGLLTGESSPPTRAIAADVAPRRVDREARPTTTSLTALLCLLVAIVFLLERIVAMRKRHPA
ncbi:BatA domain-containing protein [Dokdonella sp.]|uniref:BatA domain-containing protein n=1 Tax=Dokdonella sp. TaxID=2291710 RepID=UPI003C57FD77